MTLNTFIIKVIGKIPALKNWAYKRIIRSLANDQKRDKLNRMYLKFNAEDRRLFHAHFAKMFKSHSINNLDAYWKVRFSNQEIKMPLRSDMMWLHWDSAVSITGNDQLVKVFYERLIKSEYKPNTFFDVGANYGTHSLLFLASGIDTYSFEPNPNAYEGYGDLERLNNIKYKLQAAAVGDKVETATLTFPKSETWLGSISQEYSAHFEDKEDVEKIDVPVITLDNFVMEHNLIPELIKIDTEGFEINVLKGANQLLSNNKCIIVFECTLLEEKKVLEKEFSKLEYQIFDMRNLSSQPLSQQQFFDSKNYNYLAISKGHSIIQKLGNFNLK